MVRPAAEEVLADLKRAGLKLTPQRIAIVGALVGDVSHPTAQDLYERLRQTFPTMSFATVYNTLDALTKLGRVGSLRLGSAVRFDPNTAPHHHAICDACGAVVDLPSEIASPDTHRSIAETFGFTVRAEERSYRGLCRQCLSPENEHG